MIFGNRFNSASTVIEQGESGDDTQKTAAKATPAATLRQALEMAMAPLKRFPLGILSSPVSFSMNQASLDVNAKYS